MGLGYRIRDPGNGKPTYYHTGSMSGWNAAYEFCLETGDGIIILTNSSVGFDKLINQLFLEWRDYVDGK